jgi:hypothetical protein
MKEPQRAPHGETGFALFTTFLALMVLFTLGFTSLMISGLEVRSTNHYKTGNQSFFSSEAGIVHAISTINARGVIEFNNDIANSTQWTRLFGSAVKSMDDGSSYQIVVTSDPASPTTKGILTGFGFSKLDSRRVLRVNLKKGIRADPGALYMAADVVDPDFGARDQFLIDGNDYKSNLALNPGGPLRPGIATRNDTVTNDTIAELSDPQKLRVQGLDFSTSPLMPSVKTVGGPDNTDLDQIISYILSHNPVVTDGGSSFANATFGTLAAPQVTHLTNKNVNLNGSMSGVGILIADGEVTINGDANFIGWILVRGKTIVAPNGETDVDGNATIAGSLWTGDVEVHVGGAAIIAYCSECLALADGVGNGNNFPKRMNVVSWREIL